MPYEGFIFSDDPPASSYACSVKAEQDKAKGAKTVPRTGAVSMLL